MGLRSRTCKPLEELQLLIEHECEYLRNQVPGWRLVADGDSRSIKIELKIKSAEAGEEMMQRISAAAGEAGHEVHAMTAAQHDRPAGALHAVRRRADGERLPPGGGNQRPGKGGP